MIMIIALVTVVVLYVALNILDPMLSRIGEIKECLERLENIRRIQKEMHDLGHEWWVQDMMRQRDERNQFLGTELPRKGLAPGPSSIGEPSS